MASKRKATENSPPSGRGDSIEPSSPQVKDIYFTYGRFQPPTVGHKNLIDYLGTKVGPTTDAYVFVSHTQDSKKNPLSIYKKIEYLKKMHPSSPVKFINTEFRDCKGPMAVVNTLYDAYGEDKDLHMVVGSDRAGQFDFLKKEGVEFDTSLERDESKMSGTLMRKAAMGNSEENAKAFEAGVKMGSMTNSNVAQLRKNIREGLGHKGGTRRAKRRCGTRRSKKLSS